MADSYRGMPGDGVEILVADQGQAEILRGMGLSLRAFEEVEAAEAPGADFCLLVTRAGPSKWQILADAEYAGRLYRWGAARVRWLYVEQLPREPAAWPGCGLTADELAALAAAAPQLPPDLSRPEPEPGAGDDRLERPLAFDWQQFTVARYLEAEDEETDEPILVDSLFRGDTGLIVAPGGTGKGFGAVQLGACLAVGQSFFGVWEVPRPFRVLYVSAEESQKTVRRRTRGALSRLGLNPEAARSAAGRYVGRSIRGQGCCHLVRPDGQGGLARTQALADLDQQAEDFRPDLIFLDHFAKFIPVNEIDNMALTTACGFLEELAVGRSCAVILLHHANKSGAVYVRRADDLFRSLDPSVIRGGSSLAANVRWALMMAPLTSEFAVKTLGPAAGSGRAGTYVAARVAKKNEGRGESVFYLRHDQEGFFERVDQGREAAGPEADARRLAQEVARRELDLSAKPLGESTGGREAFGWGGPRSRRAAEKALEMGLVEIVKRVGARGNLLRPGSRLAS